MFGGQSPKSNFKLNGRAGRRSHRPSITESKNHKLSPYEIEEVDVQYEEVDDDELINQRFRKLAVSDP